MDKILIFGNGISLRYAKKEYSYEKLIKKFTDGLNTQIRLKTTSHESILNLFEFSDWYNEIIKDSSNFNESFFFEIYKKIVLLMFEKKYGGISDYREYGYIKSSQIWDKCYLAIQEKSEENFINNLMFPFKWSHELITYSISRSVAIDEENKNWIDIKYSDSFLKHLQIYKNIYTTNYYLGNLENFFENIEYLHGKINRTSSASLESNIFERKNTIGNEFRARQAILFGNNYEDKVFLNSVLKWGQNLKKISPIQEYDFLKCEVDVVGLSVQGDLDLIINIINKSPKVNIFCHTQQDKLDWELLIVNKKNCEVIFDTEYLGFK